MHKASATCCLRHWLWQLHVSIFLIYCSVCLFVQRQIFVCAVGILLEADLGDLGIQAYAVEVFITQEAAGCVFFIGAYSG